MNKTISINLGGFFFHIDEDAYQKLTRYFDAVKHSLSPEGKEEIIKDIESRIAELFQERLKNEKQVVSIIEVDEIIAIMGQPEDYRIDEDKNYQDNPNTAYTSYARPRKLYRDKDNSMLGGVLSGLGHYIGIDPLWLRIAMVILFFGFGTGLLIYILLWVLIPEAVTTSQKLEMRGEPINISNIEKKVKEGFDEITGKINSIDHQKLTRNAKSGANQVVSTIGDIFVNLFKVIAKILGVFIIFFSGLTLIGIFIGGIVMIFSSSLSDAFIFNKMDTPLTFDYPLWVQGILLILTVGIPLLFLIILGLKLVVNNMRPMNSYLKYSLLAVWIVALITSIYIGIKQATEVGFTGKVAQKEQLFVQPTDTVFLKMNFNDFYAKNVHRKKSNLYTHDENNNPIIYSNTVMIHLMNTENDTPFIQIEKNADGKTYNDARNRAEKIKYNFDIQENTIKLDNYFITDFKNKFRDQEVHIYIYLPEGTIVFPDKSISKFLTSHNSDINIYYGNEGEYYTVEGDEMKCLSCPVEKEDDSLNENMSIKINDKELNINVKDNEVNIRAN
jgi:phage shock protein PspC (stress-responsive transcriptional regulator)